MAETAELRISEAVPLAHALVSRLAEREGIRILFVKGPTAVALGARPPRPSSDVDVLCEPGRIEGIGAALEACGWRRRSPESLVERFQYASMYLFEHSVHYVHDEWPCDLDVHFNFPGFLAPENVVFDVLWSRRTTVEMAHIEVPCPDLLGQISIVALHALRDAGAHRQTADLEHLTTVVCSLAPDLRAALAALASDTGSSETLRPLFERAGLEPEASPWADPEIMRRWSARSLNVRTPTATWLIELRAAPWPKKSPLLWHALFLPRGELMSSHIGERSGWLNITRWQAQRWYRGIRHVRHGLAAARRSEQGTS